MVLDVHEEGRQAERHDREPREDLGDAPADEECIQERREHEHEQVLQGDDLPVVQPEVGEEEEAGVAPRVRFSRPYDLCGR
jgi:hypothetical protein